MGQEPHYKGRLGRELARMRVCSRWEVLVSTCFLGIDVSKKKLDCSLLLDGKLLDKSCDNSPAGFKQLLA